MHEETLIPVATRLQIGKSIFNMMDGIRKPEIRLDIIPEARVYEESKVKIDDRTFFRYFYLPFVISDVFFDYVDTVLDLTAQLRISALKKVSRVIKELKKNYEYYKSMHLNYFHRQQEMEHRDMILDGFYEDFNNEYKMIQFKVSNERKSLISDYRQFIGAVYMALIIFEVLKKYCKKADDVIESYWGECENSILTKQAVMTAELLWQYTGDCNVLKSSDLKSSSDRLLKSINETEFFASVNWV